MAFRCLFLELSLTNFMQITFQTHEIFKPRKRGSGVAFNLYVGEWARPLCQPSDETTFGYIRARVRAIF